ncbi:hypothetical protein O0L34_g14923 [Tuta absoluta]|nr:hypothetical protein O0L34_g14923 [Tuta absoluta]
MAIVEDEVRNESEEENEIEVVVEEDDGDQDSDDSDDDADEEDILEQKVIELECRIAQDPYNYDDHIDLIQSLWGLSELERWRAAFDRLQQLYLLKPEHWLLRLQTEVTLGHSAESRANIASLFQQAALDCYSIPILSEWCTWALSGTLAEAREQLDEILTRAGADPLSGKLFWDARLELEKSQLDSMSEADADFKSQQESVLWCLEESAARPLLRAEEAWPQLEAMASGVKDQKYIEKAQKQHEAALEYLQKITHYEDKLLSSESVEEKCETYQEYIDTVKELSRDDKYAECDSRGILKVLYDRATTECLSSSASYNLLVSYARHVEKYSSRKTHARTLDACTRRCPRRHTFWALVMQLKQRDGCSQDDIKSVFETALSKGMESYKEAESLWLSYLEYIRRQTDFDKESDVERLRKTFRLAWDSLAEAWGEEANDCEVPLYWARLEYRRANDPKAGKEIFEEIFKYGDNKSMSKYWEALISLEWGRKPALADHKLRDLFRRALRFVGDYPPGVARLWTDYERDYGGLDTSRECADACEAKIKEWRDNYQAMKDKMTGQKHKGKQQNKQLNKKGKFDSKKKKKDDDTQLPKTGKDKDDNRKGKRKSDHNEDGSEVKRKRDADMDTGESKGADTGGVKRSHDEDDSESVENKRKRTDSGGSGSEPRVGREACTLFVSNLEFKVDEERVRKELSKYGSIVSLRVKAGVKAFGGSICYCQYNTPESVDEALKHDRSPLDGRPMFFSRYSSSKATKPTFKYATTTEKNKLFVKNLPFSYCTKDKLAEVFDKHGKLKDVRVVTHKDGRPKGLAYIEYEDEQSAAAAIEHTHHMLLGERKLDVAISAPPPRKEGAQTAASLGQAKRETTGGMRRTQLSNLIPSVLQKPSASTSQAQAPATSANPAAAPNGSSNGDKRPMSNADFRSMLLKK